ncbi:DUF6441 family protein [Candidatus Williamhamiltonella defendens]|uniref:DUF6441 family protein n=1 Tax=Candidatus Williamhamiltonella defendens TaxID=138072 RepID=UPI001C9D6BD1|nr:DUF6441 family protein [Candidatus Hamiltonella defensa]
MYSDFKVQWASFIFSMHSKVIGKNPERLLALKIGRRIHLMGVHDKGGLISGDLLMPLLASRIGPKALSGRG